MNWPKVIWDIAKTWVPILTAAGSLGIVIFDRRPRLKLRMRHGKWYLLKKNTVNSGEVIFIGVVEVYNVSSRANAIREYSFFCREKDDDTWKGMESEQYTSTTTPEIFNQTPTTLQPYSGSEVKVQAIIRPARYPDELLVRVGIEDLFGHYKELEVKADFAPQTRAEWVSEPTLTEATAEAAGGQPTS
jgi:hypothetical protein